MLDTNERPTMQESYAGAVSEGNTRLYERRTTRADLIGAAGMSQQETGTALMRLVSEWNSGAVPRVSATKGAKELALEAAVRRVHSGIVASEEEYGPMKVSAKRSMREAAPVTKHEVEFAKSEERRLVARSTDWNMEEHKLRFQRLKTLPTVRAALLYWVKERGWDDGEYLVAKVLQHFLSPLCPVCAGSRVMEFAGNNKRGAGKPCQKCKDHKVRGQMNVPCHGRGRALLSYIGSCTARAATDIAEGAWKRSRGEQREKERQQHKVHEQVARLRRADAEDRADAGRDMTAVAEHFAQSMARVSNK